MAFQWVLGAGRACLGERSSPLLGKDEVASSNLASSSKRTPIPFGIGVLFLFVARTGDLIYFKSRGRKVPMQLAALDRVASSNLASSSKNQSSHPGRLIFLYYGR